MEEACLLVYAVVEMPCPKCGHILLKEDGVVYCEECLYVVERRGDPRFDTRVEEDEVVKETDASVEPKPTIESTTYARKRGRPRKGGPKKEPKYKKQIAKGRICPNEGCGRPVVAKGLCKRCYGRQLNRLKKKIDPSNYRGSRSTSKTCTVVGCGGKYYAKGYCKKCYSVYIAEVPNYTHIAKPEERKCTLCRRLHYAKGLCKRHYGMLYSFELKRRHLSELLS